MKKLTVTLLVCALTICCKGQKKSIYSSQDVVKEETVDLGKTVGKAKLGHIQNTRKIVMYKIEDVLIEGTTNQYGKKAVKTDSIIKNAVDKFISEITNPANYVVATNKKVSFEPDFQFELCAQNCELSILLDSKTKKIGFINLEGQEVIGIRKNLVSFLTKNNQ
ncbi:hypothetical protein [Marixanthomonas spongiae]|uniref:Uncharacterized protein n=1 Tax=Marixanthomonas spongiae TaxID=2174845 RepID=A0A2U0I0B4_9FLAO|nr:hypothetical protein [Marixanthomonas spongiae]PVW14537.1 hypothetical protein DDV96_08375 [Marixanthomonas spongiae]